MTGVQTCALPIFQVYGPLKDVDSCVKCLELGIDRVKQFAAERAAEEESKAGAAS